MEHFAYRSSVWPNFSMQFVETVLGQDKDCTTKGQWRFTTAFAYNQKHVFDGHAANQTNRTGVCASDLPCLSG